MEKKFLKLIESNITRATRGGFLVGDYVEFVKNYKTHKEFKNLHDEIKDAIEELVSCGLHVRVVGINDMIPSRYPGNPETMNGITTLVVAADQTGGRRYNNVIIPSCLVKIKNFYPNYAPIPDQFNYDNKEILSPVELKQVKGEHGTFEMVIPKKEKGKKKESYTVNYLTDLK